MFIYPAKSEGTAPSNRAGFPASLRIAFCRSKRTYALSTGVDYRVPLLYQGTLFMRFQAVTCILFIAYCLILIAALMSRCSIVAPQCGQVHLRSDSLSFVLTSPQKRHVLLDGYHLSTLTSCLPCHASLYASIAVNMPQPLSPTDLPKLNFLPFFRFAISLTLISSMAMTLYALTRRYAVLCRKSAL